MSDAAPRALIEVSAAMQAMWLTDGVQVAFDGCEFQLSHPDAPEGSHLEIGVKGSLNFVEAGAGISRSLDLWEAAVVWAADPQAVLIFDAASQTGWKAAVTGVDAEMDGL